eukprot:Pgem_evm1s678
MSENGMSQQQLELQKLFDLILNKTKADENDSWPLVDFLKTYIYNNKKPSSHKANIDNNSNHNDINNTDSKENKNELEYKTCSNHSNINLVQFIKTITAQYFQITHIEICFALLYANNFINTLQNNIEASKIENDSDDQFDEVDDLIKTMTSSKISEKKYVSDSSNKNNNSDNGSDSNNSNSNSINIAKCKSICHHCVIATSMLVASKYVDDTYLCLRDWGKICGIETKTLNSLEKELIKVLDFNLYISWTVFQSFSQRYDKDPLVKAFLYNNKKSTQTQSPQQTQTQTQPPEQPQVQRHEPQTPCQVKHSRAIQYQQSPRNNQPLTRQQLQ